MAENNYEALHRAMKQYYIKEDREPFFDATDVPFSFFGKKVTLKNRSTKEYLFVDTETYDWFSKCRRCVYTNIFKEEVPEKGIWILTKKKVKFTLKNYYYGEYLYAANTYYTFPSTHKISYTVALNCHGPSASVTYSMYLFTF